MSLFIVTAWRNARGALLGGAAFVALTAIYSLGVASRTLDVEWTQGFTEAPLLLYCFLLLRAPLRAAWWRPVAAAVPIAWIYGVHDEYLRMLGAVPNLYDFVLLHDLFEALHTLERVGALLLLALPVVVWLAAVDWRWRRPGRAARLLLAPAVLATGALTLAPARTYWAMDAVTSDEEWSDKVTAEHWGRAYTLLMREARRGSFAAGIAGFTPPERSRMYVDASLARSLDGRNVHLIVMESFVDLRLLRGVRFSKPPFSPDFAARVDPFIGSSISPVFGGETARAEFEVLCGVPSLRLYGLEFLGFTGKKTYCLPTILGDAGYRTVLTFPHGPVFFNTRHAYPGLGFQQVIYADRFSPPGAESIVLGDQDYLFDGDLFPQNLAKVRALVKEGRPFLNYVMTMYGHWPFDIDTAKHPMTIDVSPPSEDVRRIGNQMLDRTAALEAFVKGIEEVDPHGIIVLVADHLPPLPGGIGDYERLGYQSRSGIGATHHDAAAYEEFLLVIVDGQPRKLPLMRHFDLPHFILDELSRGAYCRQKRCDFGRLPVAAADYLDEYRTILGLAARR